MCDSFVGLYDSFGVARGVVAEDSGWELEDVMIVSDVSGSYPIESGGESGGRGAGDGIIEV